MKLRNFCVGLMLLPAASVASAWSWSWTQGIQVGVQGGLAQTHAQVDDIRNDSTDALVRADRVDNAGTAGRFYLGYRLNDNANFELGYTHLPTIDYVDIPNGGLKGDASSNAYAIDFSAKGRMEMLSHLFVYGKVGAAWLHMKVARTTINETSFHSKMTRTGYVGLAGAGLEYDFTKHISVDLGVGRFLRHGDMHNVDFANLGLSYTF